MFVCFCFGVCCVALGSARGGGKRCLCVCFFVCFVCLMFGWFVGWLVCWVNSDQLIAERDACLFVCVCVFVWLFD